MITTQYTEREDSDGEIISQLTCDTRAATFGNMKQASNETSDEDSESDIDNSDAQSGCPTDMRRNYG